MTFFSDEVLTILNTAIRDRIDIHTQVCVVRKGDPLIQQARVLEQADASLCLLIEQGVPLSRLIERKEELIENGKIDSQIGDQLYDQLQPALQQYKQQATSLHELAISVLGLGSTKLPQDIEKLEKKQKDIALIQKTQKEIDQDNEK